MDLQNQPDCHLPHFITKVRNLFFYIIVVFNRIQIVWSQMPIKAAYNILKPIDYTCRDLLVIFSFAIPYIKVRQFIDMKDQTLELLSIKITVLMELI